MGLNLPTTNTSGTEGAIHSAWRSGVRAFLARVALFWSPVIFVFCLLEIVLWSTGESWPLARVLEIQSQRREAIFMRGVLDQSLYAYKWRTLLERRPEILALGSSRVMKFRAEMFGDDSATFYNAGGLVTSIEDLGAFVKGFPADRGPRVLILGIDPWWLRPGRSSDENFRVSHDGALSWQEHLLALRALVRDPRMVRAGPSLLRGSAAEDRIGMHARATGQGFRYDGSLDSGPRSPRRRSGASFVDPERPTTVKRIRTGTGFFKPSPRVSGPRLHALRQALSALQSRGILVVGFAPPVCSEGVGLLETDPRHQRFWFQYRDRVKRMFDELGLPFVDASSPTELGLDDRFMIDGIHGGETLYVHLLRRMLDDPRVSEALPTASRVVDAAILSSSTDFWRADFPDAVALSGPVASDQS